MSLNTQKSSSFFIDLEPIRATHQSNARIMKRKGGGYFFGKPSNSPIKKWCKDFAFLAKLYVPAKPHDCPIKLHVTFYFIPPKAIQKRAEFIMGKKVPMTVRPDCSNLIKAVEDTLTDCGFWVDDSRIYTLTVDKFYSLNSGIEVSYTHE